MRLLAILAILVTAAILLPGVSADKWQRGGAGQACMPGKKCNAGLTCDAASNKCIAPAPVAVTSFPATSVNACDAVFARLRAAPSVVVWWSTNYHANGFHFAGVSGIGLARDSTGDLVGRAERWRFSITPLRLENVTLRIRADGQIMLNERYGPYTPVCWGERFAGFYSGDSSEVFSFQPH
jgi:hypothetical protein